ncbi:TIGR02594 family protein [Bradyrhizobium liaoningense]|uniref:TIGR02594 family protein n=1 Tax=Bradyrhizobium liaoningense TaxID=43992 RepID=UPI001BA442B8|nr:TIGR02594 family protein [Bradyrhizobium liaoningense]MBR0907487.1 TIGR02594 family protein [Bradyrhizobium liaoningense]
MFELFASRLSRCVVALALFFAAVAVFVSPASARPHHRHSAERHGYVHHASRHHHYRHYRHHARSSRFERSAAQLQASGFANAQASYDPNANGGGVANNGMANNTMSSGGFSGGSGLVSEARRYIGGNPTGRGSLWCARFMNMVLQHTGHQGTGSDMASSFARYGTRVSGPQVGAIAVMSRGRRGGHVGIITGIDAQGNPIMISGNNGNRVREAPVSRGRIYAYVMPN